MLLQNKTKILTIARCKGNFHYIITNNKRVYFHLLQIKDFQLEKVFYFCRVIKFKNKKLCQTFHQE